MSGHLRFCLPAFVLVAGLSSSPASSNPFTGLFNAAPAKANAPAAAEEQCLPRPGKSTADGRHWVYRLVGRRKCWFQAAEGSAVVRKLVQQRAAKRRLAAREENGAAARSRSVADARAELPRPAPAEPSQPIPPALEVSEAGPVLAAGIAPPIPASVPGLADDTPALDEVDMETPAAADARADSAGWNWLGLLLMALGILSVSSSSQTIQRRCAAATAEMLARWSEAAAGHRPAVRRKRSVVATRPCAMEQMEQ